MLRSRRLVHKLALTEQAYTDNPMPFCVVELPRGLSANAVAGLRRSIKQAIAKHLGTKDHRYDFVAAHENAVDSDGAMIGITVDLRPGRTALQKQAFVDASCGAVGTHFGIGAENVYVMFREIGAAEHFCGGKPISEYVARKEPTGST